MLCFTIFFFFSFLQIKDIREDVEYYIENCQEPDFAENEMIYDDIEGLEEMLLDVSNVSCLFTASQCKQCV